MTGLTGKDETSYYLKLKVLQRLIDQKNDLEFCAAFLQKMTAGEEDAESEKLEKRMKRLREDIKLTQALIVSCEKDIRKLQDGRGCQL